MVCRLPGLAAFSILTSIALVGPVSGAGPAPLGHIHRLKLLQQQIVLREPAEKLEKLERRERLERSRKARRRRAPAGARARPGVGTTDAPAPARTGEGVTLLSPATPARVATPANRRVNNPAGEPTGACQSEVSIASLGNNVVAAWNDGIGIYEVPETDGQGFGYSVDGGVTWVDAGVPLNTTVGKWSSDPVVVVNEKTGDFYYAALCEPSTSENGIAVMKGRFNGGSFQWTLPTVVVSADNSTTLFDKSWLAVDSLTGNLYLTYSSFGIFNGQIVSNQIRITRSTDGGQTWIDNQALSSPGDDNLVQGSRPAVGPGGEVYVVWHAVGQTTGPGANSPYGRDFLRVRKSTTFGASFGPEVTADSVFSNFGSGAPGFNRGMGLTFPGIAVDRSTGPFRGRVYLTWNESLNFYNDPFPDPEVDALLARVEVEPNDGHNIATPFNPGEILRGNLSFRGDYDYWKFDGIQGQTVIFYLDSLRTTLDAAFRMWCSNQVNLLGFSQNGDGGEDLLVFTLPFTATYYIRVASYSGAVGRTGGYRILTTVDTPQADPGRDHRDVFVKASDDGAVWGPTVRVSDGPPRFDDWLPDVAVDGSGRVFVAHYDYRDGVATCGAGSNVYLSRSDDGGATWIPEIPISDATSDWTNSASSLIPNQGDYLSLFARDSTVFLAWGDARPSSPGVYTNPDVYIASATFTCISAPVALVSAQASPETVTVTWSAPAGFSGNLFRRTGAGTYVDLGTVVADPEDRIVYVDDTVVPAETYSYRIGVQGYCQPFVGEVTVITCVTNLVSVVDTRAAIDTVTVDWSVPAGITATLYRRIASGPWVTVGPVTATADSHIVYVDLSVQEGQTYSYRLRVPGSCEPYVGETTVTVPGILRFELALYGFLPNPTPQDVIVSFSLETSSRATLTLYDLTGREVRRREVGHLGPGAHVVNLSQGASLRAGIYFVRLIQGNQKRERRVAIIP